MRYLASLAMGIVAGILINDRCSSSPANRLEQRIITHARMALIQQLHEQQVAERAHRQ